MRLLKKTEEYRVDSEIEAKEAMEKFRSEAAEKGYSVGSCGYTYKEKKAKGEIVEEYYKVTLTKSFTDIKEPSVQTTITYDAEDI